MSIYLVRSVETKHLHGIVWGNLDQIWDVVDEVTEPDRLRWRRFDDTRGRYGLVTRIFAAVDAQKGGDA